MDTPTDNPMETLKIIAETTYKITEITEKITNFIVNNSGNTKKKFIAHKRRSKRYKQRQNEQYVEMQFTNNRPIAQSPKYCDGKSG